MVACLLACFLIVCCFLFLRRGSTFDVFGGGGGVCLCVCVAVCWFVFTFCFRLIFFLLIFFPSGFSLLFSDSFFSRGNCRVSCCSFSRGSGPSVEHPPSPEPL